MKKLIKLIGATGVAVTVLTVCTFAGKSYSGYDLKVGRFNGSGYSYYQTKSTKGADGYIKSDTVGGSYVVDVRMESDKGDGEWLRDLDDGTNDYLPGTSKQTSGCDVRAQFSNDITTPVTVHVWGEWKSN